MSGIAKLNDLFCWTPKDCGRLKTKQRVALGSGRKARRSKTKAQRIARRQNR